MSAACRSDTRLQSGSKSPTGHLGWGTRVLVDGHLLCCDIRGGPYLLRPQPAGPVIVATMRSALGDVGLGPVWTTPVVANGRLYLRLKRPLGCFSLKPGQQTGLLTSRVPLLPSLAWLYPHAGLANSLCKW